MNCLHCHTPLTHIGKKKFHEEPRHAIMGDLGALMVNQEAFDLYHCPNCGHISFFTLTAPAKPTSKAALAEETPLCLHCRVPTLFAGYRRFHEGTRWGALGELGALMVNQEGFHIYVCPECYYAQFFSSRDQQKPPSFSIRLAAPGSAEVLAPAALLKLHPGKSNLDDVYTTLGHPFIDHTVDSGVILCYRSATNGVPHSVLIDRHQLVQLVTVYNHNFAFTLEQLEEVYGERELAGTFLGHEHWLFEGTGVAFIVEGRNDHNILYVQFFPEAVTFDTYQEADGFAKESFIGNE